MEVIVKHVEENGENLVSVTLKGASALHHYFIGYYNNEKGDWESFIRFPETGEYPQFGGTKTEEFKIEKCTEVLKKFNTTKTIRVKFEHYTENMFWGGYVLSDTKELDITLIANSYTVPEINNLTIESTPVLLNTHALFVKGKNAVKVSAQAEAKLNASITKIEWKAGNSTFQNGETSPVFATFGEIPITITATDTRGFVATHTDKITVYDYQNPTISPISGAATVLVARALSDGTLSERGYYIKVEVQKKYSPVNGKNTCKLMYRRKEQGEGKSWSSYATLLDVGSSSNEFKGVLPNEIFDVGKRHTVELYLTDTFGNEQVLTYPIASEQVFMDRRGESNSIAFGGHITESDEKGVHEIYQKAFIKGGMVFVDSTTGSKYNITVENGALKATKIT